jgi:hypothetical protein
MDLLNRSDSRKMISARLSMLVAMLLCLDLEVATASAEPYNLLCSSNGRPMATLTVRDNWIGYLTPEIRVIIPGRPGETKPVNVEAYTTDKIKVGISINFEKFPNEKSELTITIESK